jgi:hypothetical protein
MKEVSKAALLLIVASVTIQAETQLETVLNNAIICSIFGDRCCVFGLLHD